MAIQDDLEEAWSDLREEFSITLEIDGIEYEGVIAGEVGRDPMAVDGTPDTSEGFEALMLATDWDNAGGSLQTRVTANGEKWRVERAARMPGVSPFVGLTLAREGA